MDSESEEEIPQHILEEARGVALNLLPTKSRQRYGIEYTDFKKWMERNCVRKITECSVLVYFLNRAKTLKPPSLWSKYSMLRTGINIKQNTDIKYSKLIAFLKRQASGYKPKKSVTFAREEINKFLAEAPNEVYLSMKVVLLFALCGGCRCDELCKMTINVTIPDSKTKKKRRFIISDENINGGSTLAIYRKYVASRNPETPHSRFFVAFHQGKCTQ
ncbi:hypothetical protein NQ315_002901 [Exocentrus adspersus]|uniref:Tyr recombinase domain-containing protein n=1 Tax=Exocentrus adspersus TaxID=1586481 RepID=A0AAV8V6L0_9CUCU|nr:hypothetical protein NQ315_002901 [Exocentrus adspersus]